MKYKEIMLSIIEKLEKGHINLWHDIDKKIFFEIANQIKWDLLDEISFDYEMLKLFHLFKDAHTRYFIPYKHMDHKMLYKNNRLYIKNNGKYEEVKSINNIDINELYSKFIEMICYETEQWRDVQLQSSFNNKYFYEMLGIKNDLYCSINDNIKIKLELLNEADTEKLRNNYKPYQYQIIDNNILYLQFSACRNDENIPFVDFVAKIKDIIETSDIKHYILDVRGNGGGNSEILNPFQTLVRDFNLNGVMLIDSRVFSSGRFAIARFKQEFNIKTIGTPTGGAASSYGYNNNDSVEGKNFSYSIRYWDFSDIFKTRGAIFPDIYIDNTIEDINNNYDRQLESAKQIIAHMQNSKSNSKK